MSGPNAERGEASLRVAGEAITLRPTFTALVAAEAEIGPLFGVVERAVEGKLSLAELVALFWHCVTGAPATLTREALAESIVAEGLATATPVLRTLIGQILKGR